MKNYDIFLFDADGTLFNFEKAEANALESVLNHFGFGCTEDILQKYREISSEVWKGFEKGEIKIDDLQTLRFSRLFNFIGAECNVKDLNQKYLTELGKGIFLNEGALEICEKLVLHNKKLFIVTNGILQVQEARINNSPIKGYISDYFVSEYVGYQKPDIRYFEYVFSHIPQTEKDKILIIGDSLSADIAGGNNAGIDTCWYNELGNTNDTEILPTYEINKLSALRLFINNPE